MYMCPSSLVSNICTSMVYKFHTSYYFIMIQFINLICNINIITKIHLILIISTIYWNKTFKFI